MSNVIKNVEIYWAKLDPSNPVDPFGTGSPVWEVQMRTADKKVAKAWEDKGLAIRELEDEGVWACNVKKKAKTQKGDDLTPVRVVDNKLQPVDPVTIGNGSVGNVQLSPREWTFGKKSGVAMDLRALQITSLVKYTGSDLEFDVVDLGPEASGAEDEGFVSEDDDF